MAFIFLFVDGLGIGSPGEMNPFSDENHPYKSFEFLTGGQPLTAESDEIKGYNQVYKKIDACLDVEGLPQSGTGQATLFSGENASKILGRHFGPYPHSKIRFLLEEKSIFHQIQEMNGSCYFMNAFPDLFFQRAESRNRWSCCTLMTKSAGIHINTVEDVLEENAITAEILQDAWKDKLDINVPVISETQAAERVLKIARKKDFVLVEYYLTDKAGHSQDLKYAHKILERYDRFLKALLDGKDKHDTILLTSDHGNLEDLSVKTHTFNKVPLFVYGPDVRTFYKIRSISEVFGAISQRFATRQA